MVKELTPEEIKKLLPVKKSLSHYAGVIIGWLFLVGLFGLMIKFVIWSFDWLW